MLLNIFIQITLTCLFAFQMEVWNHRFLRQLSGVQKHKNSVDFHHHDSWLNEITIMWTCWALNHFKDFPSCTILTEVLGYDHSKSIQYRPESILKSDFVKILRQRLSREVLILKWKHTHKMRPKVSTHQWYLNLIPWAWVRAGGLTTMQQTIVSN